VSDSRIGLAWPISMGLLAGGLVGPLMLAAEISRVGFASSALVAVYALVAFGAGIALAVGALLFAGLGHGATRATIRTLCFGACLAAASLGSCYVGRALSVGCEQLQSEGERIVSAIEQYREKSGAYPKNLGELELKVPQTRYGPWSYGTSEQGFWLSVGDYRRDQIELSYATGHGWYCDT
jgi:hypothetical protein